MKKVLVITLIAAVAQCQASPRERLFAAIARARITGKPLVLTIERKSYWQGTQGKRLKHALELGALFVVGNGLYKTINVVTSEEFREGLQKEIQQMSEYQDMRDAKAGMHTYVSGIAMHNQDAVSLSEQLAFRRTRNALLENKNDQMFNRWIKQECECFYNQHPELEKGVLESKIEKDLGLEEGTLARQENFLQRKTLNFIEKLTGLNK